MLEDREEMTLSDNFSRSYFSPASLIGMDFFNLQPLAPVDLVSLPLGHHFKCSYKNAAMIHIQGRLFDL